MDVGAPQLYGFSGSLLAVLNACLVNGYGSKLPSGWTKPLPDTSSYGTFKQISGSQISFFLNDSGVGTGGQKESWLTGWETITAIDTGKVTGSGQFPTVAQLAIGPGAVVARKSNTADSSSIRVWTMFADASTCYLFMQSGDVVGTYTALTMGDIYSFSTGSDTWKALVIGRQLENQAVNNYENIGVNSLLGTAAAGHFMARTYTGAGASILLSKHGDGGKSGDPLIMAGSVQYPNATDKGIYLSPTFIGEGTSGTIRGVMRGLWFVCHANTTLNDGQIISGSGDFAGKTFVVVRNIGLNNSLCAIETSNTVLTN